MNTYWNKIAFIKLLWIVIFFIIPLSSCVYEQDFTYLNDQLVALNKQVSKLQESNDTKLSRSDFENNLDPRLKSLHSAQAEIGVEIEQLKRTIEELSGRVEDNEYIIKRTVERDLSDQDTKQEEMVKLSQLIPRIKELEMLVKHQQEYLGLEPLSVQEVQEQEKAVEEKEPDQREAGIEEEPKSDELELYENSLASFREEKFEQAMDGFKDFLKTYPKSDRADNAQFWIGECYMVLKQYEQAILAYQEVIKKYPKGNKVANAMLRQAVAFLEIKDKTSSKLLLKKIIKRYPNSIEARIAKAKLKTIK